MDCDEVALELTSVAHPLHRVRVPLHSVNFCVIGIRSSAYLYWAVSGEDMARI